LPDDRLWISWIDREGAIFSSGFSFFKNLPLTLILLLVLQRFGHCQWGNISELTTDNHTVSLHPVNADGTLGEEEADVSFYQEDMVYSSWTLLGRATTVVGAKREGEDNSEDPGSERSEPQRGVGDDDTLGSAPGGDLEDVQRTQGDVSTGTNGVEGDDTSVADSSSAADNERDGRLNEKWRTYYQARDTYRKAYGDIIKAHDLVLKVSWPESSRQEEWKVVAHAQAMGKADKFIKGHIPTVTFARDLDRYSTQHIRNFLGIKVANGEGHGTRSLCLMAMNRLRPIYDLDEKQFWDAFWQCVACTCFPADFPTPMTLFT
jgi:hypothetical protein